MIPLEDIYRLRAHVIADVFKAGQCGLEIGAGSYPTILPEGVEVRYFDKRLGEELQNHFRNHKPVSVCVEPMDRIGETFPEGADFLIANQVLEHCADPVRTLMEWNSNVKRGGIGVISVPHCQYCTNECDRIVPPFEHVLLDYALGRGASAFESREHILSGYLAWERELNCHFQKKTFAEAALQAHREVDDHHWHALDDELFMKIVVTAAILGGRNIRMLKYCTPTANLALPFEPAKIMQTFGEMIAVYQLDREQDLESAALLRKELADICRKLKSAASALEL